MEIQKSLKNKRSVAEKIEVQLRREAHDRYWENQIDAKILEEKGIKTLDLRYPIIAEVK